MIQHFIHLQDATPFFDKAKIEIFTNTLATGRKEHIKAPTLLKDQALRCASEYALMQAAKKAGISYAAMEIAYTGEGKPFIKNMPHVAIGISHSGLLGCVIIAVGEDTPPAVGIDIELADAPEKADAVAKRFFPNEWHTLYQQQNDSNPYAFSTLWTQLEAVAKGEGCGVGNLLCKAHFPHPYYVQSYTTKDTAGRQYVLSAASNVNIFGENCENTAPTLAITGILW